MDATIGQGWRSRRRAQEAQAAAGAGAKSSGGEKGGKPDVFSEAGVSILAMAATELLSSGSRDDEEAGAEAAVESEGVRARL